VFTSNLISQTTWLKVKIKLVNLEVNKIGTKPSWHRLQATFTASAKLPSFCGYSYVT